MEFLLVFVVRVVVGRLMGVVVDFEVEVVVVGWGVVGWLLGEVLVVVVVAEFVEVENIVFEFVVVIGLGVVKVVEMVKTVLIDFEGIVQLFLVQYN